MTDTEYQELLAEYDALTDKGEARDSFDTERWERLWGIIAMRELETKYPFSTMPDSGYCDDCIGGRRGERPRPRRSMMEPRTMNTKTPYSWKTVPLFDSDGGQPDDEQRIKAMREFRAHGCIQDYWFVDLTSCRYEDTRDEDERDPDSRVWDEFNQEFRDSWECGPTQDQVDFSDLPA